jgi:hypothetical protein
VLSTLIFLFLSALEQIKLLALSKKLKLFSNFVANALSSAKSWTARNNAHLRQQKGPSINKRRQLKEVPLKSAELLSHLGPKRSVASIVEKSDSAQKDAEAGWLLGVSSCIIVSLIT